MNLLLDTYIVIWALADSPQLPPQARDLILNTHNDIWVSAVSIWEVTIKHGLTHPDGTPKLPMGGGEVLDHAVRAGYHLLDITADQCASVAQLPDIHRDPFDRLLVAQALTVPLFLVTNDSTVARYHDSIIEV